MTDRPPASDPWAAVSPALRQTQAFRAPWVENRREIMTAVHAVARTCGWRPLASHWEVYATSYHWVEMTQGTRAFVILLHKDSPFVALSSHLPGAIDQVFLDDATFATAVQALGGKPFGVLTAAELRRPLTELDETFLKQLSRQFRSDMNYWKPDTVGEVIFNFWD